MVPFKDMENLFLKTISGLKNLSTLNAILLPAILSPLNLLSATNCSSTSPSMLSYNDGGQNHCRNLSDQSCRYGFFSLFMPQAIGWIGERSFSDLRTDSDHCYKNYEEYRQNKYGPLDGNMIRISR